jgi:hypothetical protein
MDNELADLYSADVGKLAAGGDGGSGNRKNQDSCKTYYGLH